MNKRLTTAAIALALGLAWTIAPAMAQQTTTQKVKDKAEAAKDKIEEKATDIKDKIHDKGAAVKDKLESKTHRDKDKAEDAAKSTADKAASKKDSTKDKMTSKMHRMGSKTDVIAMQQALKDKGYDPGPADGRMGPRTRAALRDYQKKEGLNPTGRWDEETGNRLGVRMSATTPTDTMHTSTPAASPAVPEDKTASPAKRNAP